MNRRVYTTSTARTPDHLAKRLAAFLRVVLLAILGIGGALLALTVDAQAQQSADDRIRAALRTLKPLKAETLAADGRCQIRLEKGQWIPTATLDPELQRKVEAANSARRDLYQGLAEREGKAYEHVVAMFPDSQRRCDNVVLRIHGSSTIGAEATPALATAFLRKQYPDATVTREVTEQDPDGEIVGLRIRAVLPNAREQRVIEIKAHGSSTAFSETQDVKGVGLEGGFCDIGQSSRKIKAEEAQRLQSKLGDLTPPGRVRGQGAEHVIALDGVAVIVHKSNPIDQLSTKDLGDIFSGHITDWSQVRGHDGKPGSHGKSGSIALYRRDDNSGTFDCFVNKVLGGNRNAIPISAHRFASNRELSDQLSRDRSGIGFLGLGFRGDNNLVAVSSPPDDYAWTPDRDSVRNEQYPLSRRLYFYLSENPNHPLARQFLQFALSDDGQDVIENGGGLIGVRGTRAASLPDQTMGPPTIAGDLRQNAVVGEEFTYQIGTTPSATRYLMPRGSAGARLTFDELTGKISARFDAAKTVSLYVQAENAGGIGPEATLTIVVSEAPTPKGETFFRMHGSNTIGADLAGRLAKAFLEQRMGSGQRAKVEYAPPRQTSEGLATDVYVSGDVNGDGRAEVVEIQPHGSDEAFTHLGKKLCEIGMSSRPIKPEEAEKLEPFGAMAKAGANQHMIGWDGIAVIVHPGNRVTQLTNRELEAVFSGRISNWQALGGTSRPITLYTRDEKSGTYRYVKEEIFPDGMLPNPDRNRFEDGQKLAAAVSEDLAGMGFVSFAALHNTHVSMIRIKERDVAEYLEPSAATVPNQSYMLSRPLYLYIPGRIPRGDEAANRQLENARAFISWVISADGQAIINAAGFFSREVERTGANTNKYILFDTNRHNISEESRVDIGVYLTRFARENRNLVRSGFLLKGYADNRGGEAYNEKLSKERADEVASEFVHQGFPRPRVEYYGEKDPKRTNDTEKGRTLNRRVEVWLIDR